ncbi:hypothetical protein B0T25DRAFT_290263 [Lasiosphaeria hispida]|uniref:Uncharacterized protein n=1 Tax=Lasiosphaeria hispida TaxID=260671 RepID=A0AAJ0MBH4_9PEZI|nr:hypothetical protein B0T25DRAFT_290263 [Lasiosphaeria hispida]
MRPIPLSRGLFPTLCCCAFLYRIDHTSSLSPSPRGCPNVACSAALGVPLRFLSLLMCFADSGTDALQSEFSESHVIYSSFLATTLAHHQTHLNPESLRWDGTPFALTACEAVRRNATCAATIGQSPTTSKIFQESRIVLQGKNFNDGACKRTKLGRVEWMN